MRTHYESITAGQLLTMKFPDRPMMIDPWLRTGETALIWAASGVGKTMLSLSLSVVVAGGGSIGQWKCPRPKRVLYVDGEMHQQDLRDRVELLLGTLQAESGDVDPVAVKRNLTFICRQAQTSGGKFYDLTDRASQESLLLTCQDLGTDLLVLDNFTTLTDDLADENASTSFKSVQSFFLGLKQHGVTTLMLHHSRKDGQAMRGSTSLEATFEAILGLIKPEAAAAGEANFRLQFQKFRSKGSEALQPSVWQLCEFGWKIDEDEGDTDVRVLACLKTGRFPNQKAIKEHLKLAPSTVSKSIQRMKARGILTDKTLKAYWFAANDNLSEDLGDDDGYTILFAEKDNENVDGPWCHHAGKEADSDF